MRQPVLTATLVAIVKNESFYLTEWIAYHFLIGFQSIIVFNNDSTDETWELLNKIAELDPRLTVIDWPSQPGVSPQDSAYNHAVRLTSADWLCFLDIDEFLVPWEHKSILNYLTCVPEDVAQVHVNWRGFGSNGETSLDYELVTETFTSCASALWTNNAHYKSLVRRTAIAEVFIHYASLRHGRRCLTDFSDVASENFGVAPAIVYNGIHINHYQCKTYPEFRRRRNNGGAHIGLDDKDKFRNGSYGTFLGLDHNEERNNQILPFAKQARTAIKVLEQFLPQRLTIGALKRNWLQLHVENLDYDLGIHSDERRYFFVTYHGNILCRPKTGPEMEQHSLFEDQSSLFPITIHLEHQSQDLPLLSLRNRLMHPVALPENLPFDHAELVHGSIKGSIAVRFEGRYLTAHDGGHLTLRAEHCAEHECFLLLSEQAFAQLRDIGRKAWRLQDSEQLVLPWQIRIGSNFTLCLGELSVDLRSFAPQSQVALTQLTLQLTGGTEKTITPVSDWQSAAAESSLKAAESDRQSFPQIVASLMQAGFEGYAIDFRQASASFYAPDGSSIQRPAAKASTAVAALFNRSGIIAAVKEARNNAPGYSYIGFCEKLAAAGCAGYIVSFTGKRALYFGRAAETLVEQFS